MKPSIIICLLILSAYSQAFGATNCKIVEYVDRNEAICIGDEITALQSTAPATTSRATVADYIAKNLVPAQYQAVETAPSDVRSQDAATAPGVGSQPSAPQAAKPDTAAENLAKRRELATRNSRNLLNYTSASTPAPQ